jgi:hypothetical protein
MSMAVFASLREVTMVAGLGRWLTQSGDFAIMRFFFAKIGVKSAIRMFRQLTSVLV